MAQTNVQPLYQSKQFAIYKDRVVQGNNVAQALSATEMTSNYQSTGSGTAAQTLTHWKLTEDISALPKYTSDYVLLDALYNRALEEMQQDMRPDHTFMAGAKWDGVWTRDISYSIILSLAWLHPDIARNSLMRKVKNGKVIQDTGTGGSYPVSTDRMIWVTAAWEVYKATGDTAWLRQAYNIAKASAADDALNIYDAQTGLMRGESSFLDWREQSYPKWMTPIDIYQSECLGTNVVHFASTNTLYLMARELRYKDESIRYRIAAEKLKLAINKNLWMDDKGYYGQYLYGRIYTMLSPRSEALGEALAVLFDIADDQMQHSIIKNTPLNDYGTPTIYPQIPGIPAYHNNSVWPFVQSFWSLAAAKAGNEKALTESMSAIYRAAALFLTNKENYLTATGDYYGTQVNSDRQLWSVAGNIAQVYRIVFGMQLLSNTLRFTPFIPEAYQGTYRLTNFKYRNAILDIKVTGYGNNVSSFMLDGEQQMESVIPATLTGKHSIKIVLSPPIQDESTKIIDSINMVADHTSPATPETTVQTIDLKLTPSAHPADDSTLAMTWKAVPNAVNYHVLRNGVLYKQTTNTYIPLDDDSAYNEYSVIAIDAGNYQSFASEPIFGMPDTAVIYEIEKYAAKSTLPYKGYSGNGFVETSTTTNKSISIPITINESGTYAIDFRYANGNGPLNTDNKCAIRTLKNGDIFLGTIVMPQRGQGQWNAWGHSNAILVHLDKGTYTLTLSLEPANENMNGDVNQAMLDYMQVQKVKN